MEPISFARNDQVIHQLQNKNRQLDCIHAIFNIMVNLSTPFDQLIRDIAETVLLGFRNPEGMCSCLIVDNMMATTANYKSCDLTIEADITLNEKTAGKLEIGFLEPLSSGDSGFIEGEKKFIQAIADRIGLVLECKKMKDDLQKSEKKYRYLSENALVGIYQTNHRGDILYMNNTCLQMLGFSSLEQAMKEGAHANYRHPDDRIAAINLLNQNGMLLNYELELIKKTGESIFVLLCETVESDIISGMMMDITDRKDYERRLQKSRKNLADAQRIAHLGSWDWDISKGNICCSDEAYRIFGKEPQEVEVTYFAFLDMVHPDDRPEVKRAAGEVLKGLVRENPIEFRIVLPDGQRRIVLLRGEVICNENRIPIRMIGTVFDITKTKMQKKALEKAFEELKRLKDQLEAENIYLRDEIEVKIGNGDIIGVSDPIKYVLYRIKQVALTKTTTLLTGETGVGKGIFARFIHRESDRGDKHIVQVNCAGLPANLIESELFGREKGAFTGSTARQIGRFELADKSSIFLDEIGELPIELQAKLLRVIEDGEFERLGSPNTVKVDVRIIASTNRNLKDEIKKGRFREDLFFRLNVFPITIPPLRQRKEDIPLIVRHFIKIFSKAFGKNIKRIPRNTMQYLEEYPWPGNVRELINVIERAVIVSPGPELRLVENMGDSSVYANSHRLSENPIPFEPKSLGDVERDHILGTLQETGWRIEGPKGAAQVLSMNPSTVRNRMRKLGIVRPGKK